MRGASPAGVRGEQDTARWVRTMFGRVAHRYDLANHLLSFNIDRLWRARTVARVSPVLERPGVRVLDLCCGTGDLLLALGASRTIGADFCHPMLVRALEKGARAVVEADALSLPFPGASLDLITTAFGFRNLANYDAGLREMRRVLRPGGMAAILEFSQPPNRLFGALYAFYSRRVLPWIGGALSGSRDAYSYLPESVRKFPAPDELASMMRTAGLSLDEVERQLCKESGLKGLSGTGSNDVRDIQEQAAQGNAQAQLAIEVLVQQTRHWIGSYLAQLNGADALVFTAGIGENRAEIREDICRNLDQLGIPRLLTG
jgi:demethylmenaquinone methyltransferase/2-methoxy-6-polyprenyl-1,4-benzoquinol methylase